MSRELQRGPLVKDDMRLAYIPDTPITDTARANNILAALYRVDAAGGLIVCRERVRIASIPDGFALVVHMVPPVQGDRDFKGGDLTKLGGGSVTYKATFMRQLANTAGLKTVRTERVDDDQDPFRREVEVTVSGIDLALRHRTWVGRYELDLRDGAQRHQDANTDSKMNMLRSKRTHITTQAETGAFCRAVANALSINRGLGGDGFDPCTPVVIPAIELYAAGASEAVRDYISMRGVDAMLGIYGDAPQIRRVSAPPVERIAAPVTELPVDDDGPEVDEGVPFDVDTGDADEDFEMPGDDDHRSITEEEKQHLKKLGCYTPRALVPLGWDQKSVPTLAIYRAAVEKFGGAG